MDATSLWTQLKLDGLLWSLWSWTAFLWMSDQAPRSWVEWFLCDPIFPGDRCCCHNSLCREINLSPSNAERRARVSTYAPEWCFLHFPHWWLLYLSLRWWYEWEWGWCQGKRNLLELETVETGRLISQSPGVYSSDMNWKLTLYLQYYLKRGSGWEVCLVLFPSEYLSILPTVLVNFGFFHRHSILLLLFQLGRPQRA